MDHELLLLAVLVLSVVSLFQLISLRRRISRLNIDTLERRLSDLASLVRRLAEDRKSTSQATEAAAPPTAPTITPPAVASPAAPPPATQLPVIPVQAAMRPPSSPTQPPPRPPSPFAQSVRDILSRIWQWILVGEEHRPKGVTIEYAVATTWLVRAGIVALVFGVGFFLKWSIDRNLLGPTARVSMSVVFGLAMLGSGLRLLGRRWNLLGQGFTGGGLAVLYFSMYALGPLYKLVDSTALVFALMILVTVSAGVLALYANSMLVAIFGIIGGFLTPVLLHTDTPNLPALYGYLLLLNLGILGIAHARQWRLLNYLSFVFTWLLYAASRPAYTRPDFPVALAILCLFFVVQSTLVFLYNLRRRIASSVLELIHLVLNGALFSFAAYWLIRDAVGRPWPAVMTLGLALYYILHVTVFVARGLKDRGLLIALIALAGVYTTMTMPLTMEQESLTMAWALQALMFVWIGHRMSSHFLRQLGYGVYLITLWRLLAFEVPRIDAASAAHHAMADYWKALIGRVWTFGVSIASIAVAFLIERRQALARPEEPLPDTPDVAPAGLASRVFFWSAVVFLFLYLHLELFTMFGYLVPWRPAALTLLWCAAGLLCLALHRGSGSTVTLAMLGVFLAGAVAKTLCIDLPYWHLSARGFFAVEWSPFLALTRWVGFAAVLALLAGGWRVVDRRDAAPVARPFGYTALALLWLYATLELNSLLRWRLPTFQAGGVSVLWTLFALAFVSGGIWKNVRPIRFAGLVLFAIVIAKVFAVDLRHMPSAYRVIAFMAVGALLLLGSFAYLRANRKFATNEESPS